MMGGIARRAFMGRIGAAAGLLAAGAGGLYGFRRLTRRRPDHADVAYGLGARQRLDIYLPEAATGPVPFVIDIHGGAFRIGDKAMNAPSDLLLAAGIAIVRPNYRLTGTDLWPAQGEDCLAAARLVLEKGGELGLDPARFALWGQSAGAFLAVSTALSLIEAGQPPRAVASFYGPMDFATMDADMAALGRTAAMGPPMPPTAPSRYFWAALWPRIAQPLRRWGRWGAFRPWGRARCRRCSFAMAMPIQ